MKWDKQAAARDRSGESGSADRFGAPRLLEPKKVLISVILGALGFTGSFFTLNFSVPPFSLSINWFDFLPLLAGMAFGGRYGLVASTIGLGAFYPFFIWSDSGWACLVASLLLVYWPTANGYMRSLRQRCPTYWNHPYLIYPLSVLVFNSILYVFYPIAMRFNPPFWNPQAEPAMSSSTLQGIVIKGSIVLGVVLIFDDCLLKLPAIRRLFGLEVKKASRYNGNVALIVMIGSMLVWYLFVLFDRVLLVKPYPQSFFRIADPHEAIALVVFLAAGIIFCSVLISYQESRLKAEDSLATNEERLHLAVTAANIGIWDWDVVRDVTIWNERMFTIHGIPHVDPRDIQETWKRTVHPDDRRLVDDELRMAVLGRHEYGPEFRIVRPDGSLRFVKAASRALRDKEDKALRIIGVTIDMTENKEAEFRIRQSLAEKEILLREVHHRVKNNLQVIYSLVSLQESSCRDGKDREMNLDTQARILSMARLHELLYGSPDLSSIDPGEYLNAIVEELTSYHGGFKVRIDTQPDALSIDEAMPLGLIATELLTNAMKYAYPQGTPGEIFVSYGLAGQERRLLVSDNGVGLPTDPVKLTSLGFTLVRSLTEQIGGQLTMRATRERKTNPGLTVALSFKRRVDQAT
jgi:PAS domain S-box-containing protein